MSPRNISDRFGEYFASMLMELPTGEWQGPVESAYGLHLVFKEKRRETRSRGFEQARREVLRDYMREQEEKSERAVYEQLRRNYSVDIETADFGKEAAQAGER